MGSPVSEWSWIKTTLPSNRGEITPLLNAPAALLLLAHALSLSLRECLATLPVYLSTLLLPYLHEDIDAPLHQCHMSTRILDQLIFSFPPGIRALQQHSNAIP